MDVERRVTGFVMALGERDDGGSNGRLRSCRCGHLHRWHGSGACRILNCECGEFVEKFIRYTAPGAGVVHGHRPSHRKRRSP